MARLSKKQFDRAYANYKKRYRAKAKLMKRRGLAMEDTMLNKKEYKMVRQAYIDDGRTININQTIVSDQQYSYGQKVAMRFKKVAEERNLDWKKLQLYKIRSGEIDVSGINNWLREDYPEWTGTQRADFISHEIFGSE